MWFDEGQTPVAEESAGDIIGAALGGSQSAASPAWYQTAGGWASDAASGIGGFLKANAGALLGAYAADRNAAAAQATASRNATAGLGVPVRPAVAGIDRRIWIGGGIAAAVLAVVWLARRK